MVRSEERLQITTQTRPVERVHTRKHVVTETAAEEVTLRRREPSVDHEQVDEPGRAVRHDASAQAEFEIILHEERVEVRAVAVPVERVRVRVVTVAGEQTVTAVLRSEQLDLTIIPADLTLPHDGDTRA